MSNETEFIILDFDLDGDGNIKELSSEEVIEQFQDICDYESEIPDNIHQRKASVKEAIKLIRQAAENLNKVIASVDCKPVYDDIVFSESLSNDFDPPTVTNQGFYTFEPDMQLIDGPGPLVIGEVNTKTVNKVRDLVFEAMEALANRPKNRPKCLRKDRKKS